MAIRIEAGKIKECKGSNAKYERTLKAIDVKFVFMQHTIYAKTKDELEIIDHENFMKE